MLKKMKMTDKLSYPFTQKTNLIVMLISSLSVAGTSIVLSGGVWDALSHIMKEPEFFWTIQHVVVYSGVGMSTVAGILGYIVYKTGKIKKFSVGIRVTIIGVFLQIIAGFGDSISHDLFGIDGLISLSHQPLELGLVLVSLGGFLILRNITSQHKNKLLPFSIMSIIISASWLGFNLLLLVGGILMCLPIYEIFSSGCAIL